MSVEAMAIVLHHSKTKGTDKVILLGIANHDGDGGAWPSLATLARYANVSESSARAALRRIEALGEVFTHLNAGGTHRTPAHMRPNRYDLTLACPATCDRTTRHRMVPLPEVPADLWKDPHRATGGGTADQSTPHRSTGGGAHRPTGPEPSTQPPTNTPAHSAASTTDRARVDACFECGLDEAECQRRIAVSGHAFTPRGVA